MSSASLLARHSFRQIKIHRCGHYLRIEFQRKMLVCNADIWELDQDLSYLVERLAGYQVVVDFSRIEFFRMNGIGVLHSFKTMLEERRASLVLCCMQPHLRIVCDFCKCQQLFTFSDELVLPPRRSLAA